jgi:hypothetical protein
VKHTQTTNGKTHKQGARRHRTMLGNVSGAEKVLCANHKAKGADCRELDKLRRRRLAEKIGRSCSNAGLEREGLLPQTARHSGVIFVLYTPRASPDPHLDNARNLGQNVVPQNHASDLVYMRLNPVSNHI